ncbi:similar to Kazachstania africana KAFR_0F03500 hypothetical protein [Maudiozyma barnettii]|uniref:Uncharacterized protein n=1 Tax=Maudiozyma barnettii TaxID=61262 RepID=A0A8H2VJU7_9SACH|nr:uncharacterized protein KABA2_11S02354 [Kazachstania barnettii]CAB4256746.1 similar to Kazachstania africana KAFR_0F03500 hypothetical protein [Kazachstania barnettii]CAD1785401.1 similar to Kazachstania africana KAFR_0F03500 hypothetical protein [Kazachstania barnettii]
MSTPLERRKLKFSNTTRDEIRNDLLKDVALLSRSQGPNQQLESLKTDATKRVQLLSQIKEETDDSNIEHGLRKLREIIVSMMSDGGHDNQLLTFAEEVYIMSYAFFLRRKEWGKVGGIVLEFAKDNLHDLFYERGFLEVYILYLSHLEHNLTKCIDMILQGQKYNIIKIHTALLRLSVIYCDETSPPTLWFRILQESQLKEKYPQAYQLLEYSGKIAEMQERCFNIIKVSYNQISWQYLEEDWLLGIPMNENLRSTIENTYLIIMNNNGSRTIMLKKPKA